MGSGVLKFQSWPTYKSLQRVLFSPDLPNLLRWPPAHGLCLRLHGSWKKDCRADVEVAGQSLDVSAVEFAATCQQFRDCGFGNACRFSYGSLGDALGLDQVRQHFGWADIFNRMMLGLVFLREIRKHIQISILAGREAMD